VAITSAVAVASSAGALLLSPDGGDYHDTAMCASLSLILRPARRVLFLPSKDGGAGISQQGDLPDFSSPFELTAYSGWPGSTHSQDPFPHGTLLELNMTVGERLDRTA